MYRNHYIERYLFFVQEQHFIAREIAMQSSYYTAYGTGLDSILAAIGLTKRHSEETDVQVRARIEEALLGGA